MDKESMTTQFYLGLDDTDTIDAPRGTGKLARWMEQELPEGCTLWGVVRQQLLVHEDVPYTSHNSAACLVINAQDATVRQLLLEKAIAHIGHHFMEGSDPGLCLVERGAAALPQLVTFGQRCVQEVVRQEEALTLAASLSGPDGVHLSAHGGTGDGVIGALACVGLTAWGWTGRCIELGGLRSLPDDCTVEQLRRHGMQVVSIDRDAQMPGDNDCVRTFGWCRPRLMGGEAVLLVRKAEDGVWESLGRKRNKKHGTAA